jgi:hypothetical protein
MMTVIGRVRAAGLIAVTAAGLAAGCGSSATRTTTGRRASQPPPAASTPSTASPQQAPAPPASGKAANPAAVSVIQAWSDALRRGDVRGAARYFALPSVMINGSGVQGQALVISIHTRAQAEAANASLPCGARFISAEERGRYVNVLFRLTDRPGPGGGCGTGAGQTARTNFVIARGHIVEWIRAPDQPDENGPPPSPQPSPPATAPNTGVNA